MNTKNISNSIGVLNGVKSNTIWSGSAATSLTETLNEIITSLENEKNNITKFDSAVDLLEQLKRIDNEIVSLRNSYIDVTNIEDPEKLKDASSKNTYLSSLISAKTNERDKIRNDIISILSEFGILADISIINIPDLSAENIEVLYKYEMGCICKFTTSDGQQYEAYVPYKINPTDPLIVYDSGGMSGNPYPSDTDWIELKKYFEDVGYDHIILKSMRQDTSKYYLDLCEKLNLDPESRLFISHSGGFRTQYEEYYDLLMEDGQLPGVLAMMDGYINLSPKIIDKIIEDETIIFGFHQNYMNEAGRDYVTKGKNENLHLLILSDKSEYGKSHAGLRNSLTENGVIQYLTNNGELPNNYEIKYYNPSDENADSYGYVVVDYEKVKTLDDVYDFFGVER